jgi:hypothetical protein
MATAFAASLLLTSGSSAASQRSYVRSVTHTRRVLTLSTASWLT